MNNHFFNTPTIIIKKIISKYENVKRQARVEQDLEELKKDKHKIINSCTNGYKVKPTHKILNLIKEKGAHTDEFFIGEIDQDGFIMTKLKEFEEIPNVEETKYLHRERFGVSLIVKDGYLAVRKEYGKNKNAFIKEIKGLYKAGNAGCNVPEILDIDFQNLTLFISYIQGKVLREELAKKGAIIRDSQVGKNSDFSYLKRTRIVRKRIKEGKRYLFEVVDNSFIKNTFSEYAKLHLNGIVNNDIKYGNIIIEEWTKKPFIIDFERSFVFQNPKSFRCKLLAKHDMYILKKHFT